MRYAVICNYCFLVSVLACLNMHHGLCKLDCNATGINNVICTCNSGCGLTPFGSIRDCVNKGSGVFWVLRTLILSDLVLVNGTCSVATKIYMKYNYIGSMN